MKNKTPIYFLLIIVAIGFLNSCKTKEKTLENSIKKVILQHERSEMTIDSLKVVEIDSLTKFGYAKVVLEQLEYMEFEYVATLNSDFSLSDSAYNELEIMIEEIRYNIDFFRSKTAENTDNEEFFCYFVTTDIWTHSEVTRIYYLLTADFKILEDPFSDHVLE